MNPLLIATLISGAISAVVGFGLAWQLQAGHITQLKLDQSDERSSIQRTARQNLERYMQTVSTAQANATTRSVALRTAADRTRDVGNGLRLQTATTVRTAASDPAASADAAAALGAVFNQCSTELESMGEVADRHASDAQTLVEAWPK